VLPSCSLPIVERAAALAWIFGAYEEDGQAQAESGPGLAVHRGSLQANARKVSNTLRLTPAQEAAYSLDYGISRDDLKPEVQAEYDRLLAERQARPPAPFNPPKPISAETMNQLWWQFVRRLMHTKTFWILGALWAVIFFSFTAYVVISPGVNFQTLRSDLAKVHLPSGYRLVAQHRDGTDCHDQCSITQTWAWTRSSPRTTSAACADVFHALNSAYPGTESNSPIPAYSSCDYYALPAGDSFNPGQGKPEIDGVVETSQTHTHNSFLIELTGAYS
jgi:hypothetical protein